MKSNICKNELLIGGILFCFSLIYFSCDGGKSVTVKQGTNNDNNTINVDMTEVENQTIINEAPKKEFDEAALGYNTTGITLYTKGEYKEAVDNFTQAIVLDPNYIEAYNNRGLSYDRLNENFKAIEDYSMAILLDDKFTTAYINRGHTYQNIGKHNIAIKDFNKVLSISPRASQAYNSRGKTYAIQKRNDIAIEDFSSAILINPDFFEAYNNRGKVYFDIQKFNEAIIDHTKAINLEPKVADSYMYRAANYYFSGNYQEAISDYDMVNTLTPDNPIAYTSKGNIFAKLENNSKAISCYNQAIEIHPYSEPYEFKGNIYRILEKYEDAIEAYTKAINLLEKPDNPMVYYSRGGTFSLLEKYNQALSDFNKALEINPDFVIVLQEKAFVLRKLGRNDEAQIVFDKFNKIAGRLNANEIARISKGEELPETPHLNISFNEIKQKLNNVNFEVNFKEDVVSNSIVGIEKNIKFELWGEPTKIEKIEITRVNITNDRKNKENERIMDIMAKFLFYSLPDLAKGGEFLRIYGEIMRLERSEGSYSKNNKKLHIKIIPQNGIRITITPIG